MTLARDINNIERASGLSPETRDTALKEIIEGYRGLVKQKEEEAERICKSRGEKNYYRPLLEKVIAGETTFMGAYNKLPPFTRPTLWDFYFFPGNEDLIGSNNLCDAQDDMEVLDRTIQRLYKKCSGGK